jgi:hypothetical protein
MEARHKEWTEAARHMGARHKELTAVARHIKQGTRSGRRRLGTWGRGTRS